MEGSPERVLQDHLAYTYKGKDIHRLTKRFGEAIELSRGFSWMGIFKTEDRLRLAHVVVYLEQPESLKVFANGRREPDVVGPFAALSLAVRPHVSLDLYYSRPPAEGQDRVSACQQDIEARYEAKGDLLWEDLLSPPVASP